MDWSNEEVLEFLERYKNEPCIWNPQHADHKNRKKVAEAWERIQDTLNFKCNLSDLKRKKDSLMASFRSLLNKMRKSINSGTEEIYQPCWFAFEPMEKFLGPFYNLYNPNTEANFLMDTDDQSNVSEVGGLKLNDSDVENAEFKYETTKNHTPHKIPAQNASEIQISMAPKKQKTIEKSIDIDKTEKSMEQALYHILKESTTKEPAKDDCDFYASLLAAKLRRFDVFQREEIMLEIDTFLLKKRRNLTEAILV